MKTLRWGRFMIIGILVIYFNCVLTNCVSLRQRWYVETETIKNGDNLVKEIAASSIIAKVSRDNLMIKYDQTFPGYFFKQNMGYGTARHIKALLNFGPCPIHRKTFKPVKNL